MTTVETNPYTPNGYTPFLEARTNRKVLLSLVNHGLDSLYLNGNMNREERSMWYLRNMPDRVKEHILYLINHGTILDWQNFLQANSLNIPQIIYIKGNNGLTNLAIAYGPISDGDDPESSAGRVMSILDIEDTEKRFIQDGNILSTYLATLSVVLQEIGRERRRGREADAERINSLESGFGLLRSYLKNNHDGWGKIPPKKIRQFLNLQKPTA